MKDNGNYLSFDIFPENVINLYTKNVYNFRHTALDKEFIDNEFRRLEKEIDYEFGNKVFPIQTHSTNIAIVNEDNINDIFDDCDGVITNLKNVALGTISADCQCILLYDKKNQVIGSIHSGWKGTRNKIIVNAINMMIDSFNSDPKDIICCIAPSIGKCCFEVDEDFNNDFINIFGDKYSTMGDIVDGKQKYYIDTLSINKDILLDLGVDENNIYISDICTKCNKDTYHSYRGIGIDTGRGLALICMRGE